MTRHTLVGGINISDADFTEEELSLIYGVPRAGMGVPGQTINEKSEIAKTENDGGG